MSFELLSEIWNRRSLILLLAINGVKIRYRNSVLGFFWTFLEPLLMLTVLYFVFTNIMKSDIENYPLYILSGLIIWYTFSRATGMGLSSLLGNSAIIQKTYFRRELLVISTSLTAFIMMIFEFVVLGAFFVVLQFLPPITILLLPLILIDLFILSLGISFLLSVLYIFFRDIKFIWEIILRAGFFLTPIVYTMDLFPENIRTILSINPLVPIFDTTRGLILYNSIPSIETTLYIILTTAIIFVIGFVVFQIKNRQLVEAL